VRPTRRQFLATGALVIGFALAPRAMRAQSPPLPGSLNGNRRLEAWLRIDPNGTVTIFTGKIELGQASAPRCRRSPPTSSTSISSASPSSTATPAARRTRARRPAVSPSSRAAPRCASRARRPVKFC